VFLGYTNLQVGRIDKRQFDIPLMEKISSYHHKYVDIFLSLIESQCDSRAVYSADKSIADKKSKLFVLVYFLS
jgi:hypothetical protein